MNTAEKRAAIVATLVGSALQVAMVAVGHSTPAVAGLFGPLGVTLALVTGVMLAALTRWQRTAAAAGWGAAAGALAGEIGVLVSIALGDVPPSLLLLAGVSSAVGGALGAAGVTAARRRFQAPVAGAS